MTEKKAIKEEGTKVEKTMEQEEKKVDERYKDEGAADQLVIISSDDVHFYVSKFFVLAASTVFRSMIQDCTGTPADLRLTDDKIERAPIVRLLLDLACGHEWPDFDALPSLHVFDLLKLCDKYDCVLLLRLMKLLNSRPAADVPASAVHRFFFASILDDSATAHRLLPPAGGRVWSGTTHGEGPAVNIVGASALDLTAMSTEWQDRLPRKYFQALLRASRLRMTQPPGSWQSVADDFRGQIKHQEAALTK